MRSLIKDILALELPELLLRPLCPLTDHREHFRVLTFRGLKRSTSAEQCSGVFLHDLEYLRERVQLLGLRHIDLPCLDPRTATGHHKERGLRVCVSIEASGNL